MHVLQGNAALGDGSVQHFNTSRLRQALKNAGDSRIQLAFPGDDN